MDMWHQPNVWVQDRQETTAAQRYGIRTFVYSRRRPFHPQRYFFLGVFHNMTASLSVDVGSLKNTCNMCKT